MPSNSVVSAKVNCRDFSHKIKKGDIIKFNMCGEILTRPVLHVSKNHKTIIVLTAKNESNKEKFTLYQEWSCGSSEKKYFNADDSSEYNNNLMIGFVRFSQEIKIISHKKIPDKISESCPAPLLKLFGGM